VGDLIFAFVIDNLEAEEVLGFAPLAVKDQ
jgi:hypothetical protein